VIFAIDPGPTESAFVFFDPNERRILDSEKVENWRLYSKVRSMAMNTVQTFVIETIVSYGMRLGDETLRTVEFIGAIDYLLVGLRHKMHRLTRPTIKGYLCSSVRATDANVRAVLIDKFGGRDMAIGHVKCKTCKGRGTTRAPGVGKVDCIQCAGSGWTHKNGPLYGVSHDVWSALAVAVTFAETHAAVNTGQAILDSLNRAVGAEAKA
jgi:hypothetical protein